MSENINRKNLNLGKCPTCDEWTHFDLIKKISKSKIFYDLIYNPSITNFLDQAKKSGHKIINGKMMLLLQAQKAFEIWHGFLPKIDDNLIKFLDND